MRRNKAGTAELSEPVDYGSQDDFQSLGYAALRGVEIDDARVLLWREVRTYSEESQFGR